MVQSDAYAFLSLVYRDPICSDTGIRATKTLLSLVGLSFALLKFCAYYGRTPLVLMRKIRYYSSLITWAVVRRKCLKN